MGVSLTVPSPIACPLSRVDGSPDEVAARLTSHLLVVRSIWFPTPRELRTWERSGHRLYVRRLSATSLEVGPRLHSMWAACFSPVWRGTLTPHGSASSVEWRRTVPRFTLGLLVMWWIATASWLAAFVPVLISGDLHPAWLIFWCLLALASTAGPAVGWVMGGRALDAADDDLARALTLTGTEDDW